jgi:hypothetical protein
VGWGFFISENNLSREIIGWREWVSLPGLRIDRIKAKVDTGARTSALHAFELDTVNRRDGLWVTFAVHPNQRDEESVVRSQARVTDRRIVRDSGGHEEERFVISTDVEMGGERWPIELTLTARDNMGFRMLLGRTAMRGRYVVDPARSYSKGRRN